MEKGRARSAPHKVARLGAPLVATALVMGCASAVSTSAPNQPPASNAAPAGEAAPDGYTLCSVHAKASGRNALSVTLEFGDDTNPAKGKFTVVADSVEGYGAVAREDGVAPLPFQKLRLVDPGDEAVTISVSPYVNDASVPPDTICATDFYPQTTPLPAFLG